MRAAAWFSATCAALLCAAGLGAAMGAWARLDHRAFAALAVTDSADPPAHALESVAQLASPTATVVLLAVLLLGTAAGRVRRRLTLAVFVALGAVTAVELAAKSWLVHAGPPPVYHHQFETFTILYANSFPSGHAARALVLGAAAVVATVPGRRLPVAAVVGAVVAVILVSRLYLGEHWVSDVIGGVLLGLVPVPWLAVAARRGPGVGWRASG